MQKWFPAALKKFKIYSVFDLLLEYIDSGSIRLTQEAHPERTTYHDPCNYGRKSEKAFGHGYYEEGRIITKACCGDYQDMEPNREFNYCCGAGGGAWAMPYSAERIFYGRIKARQIQDTGARLVIAPCHNCRDQLKKSLNKEFDLNIEVKYLWELVADSLIMPEQAAQTDAEQVEREI
ncbi:MAG: hypothetical protein BWK76_07735 [Desulfobulbaceae bacterium A2]|nr:MAG: hypothetical protein BWK76_07735 [Desulfobulbaceae bacterium A2]